MDALERLNMAQCVALIAPLPRPHLPIPRLVRYNRASSTITILSITSNAARVYPFEVFLVSAECGLPKDSKVQAQQIRTIAKERITGSAVGKLNKDKMREVDAAISLHLGI